MLIPWNTDAPLYHGPWATIALIVINTLVFGVCVAVGHEGVEEWILVYGDGLHPLQWLTSNFIHGGFLHLLGNMFCLWGFGLVIEGKVGWLSFVATYLGLGVVQSGFEQAMTLSLDGGGSFGASAIIYGLIGMAMVWAPKNDMQCLFILGFRVFTFDISIMVLAMLSICLEVGLALFAGMQITSAVLHLSGAVLGFGLACILLKANLVDCERWDLFAVLAGSQGKVRDTQEKEIDEVAPEQLEARKQAKADDAQEHIRRLVREGHALGAQAVYRKMADANPSWQLMEGDLRALVQALHQQKHWSEAVPLMVDYLRLYPTKSERIRLSLAQILLQEQQRPGQALRVLSKLEPDALPDPLKKVHRQLTRQAEKLREESPLELEAHDW